MNNYHTVYADLPTSISAYCIREKESDYITIVLNARMNCETQKKAYMHEVDHIEHGDLEVEEGADKLELSERGMT